MSSLPSLAAIGRLHFTPDALQDNVHTLLASVSDIALGGPGHVNGIPARVKRRESFSVGHPLSMVKTEPFSCSQRGSGNHPGSNLFDSGTWNRIDRCVIEAGRIALNNSFIPRHGSPPAHPNSVRIGQEARFT